MQNADNDVSAEIFNVTWIRSHSVYQIADVDGFYIDLSMSPVWFVNAHLVWYNASGAALSSGTLLSELTSDGYEFPSPPPDWAHSNTCVALSREPHNGGRQRLNFISCTDYIRLYEHTLNPRTNSFFACVSTKQIQKLKCPRGWTTATVESSGRRTEVGTQRVEVGKLRVEVGKCYKRLNQSYKPNNMTWDGARALCLREGGDLLSVGTDLEGVWLYDYANELRALNEFNQPSELWLYINMHEKLYCSNSNQSNWCWRSGLAWGTQGALVFPNWNNAEPNNGENTGDEDCVVLAAKAEQMGLTDVYCNREYTGRSHPTAVVCELTPHPTQPPSTAQTPLDAAAKTQQT